MSDTSNSGTLVQTVQVDVLQEMCIVSFNSYYKVGDKQKLNDPDDNLQQTAEDCCAVCAEDTSCNAWQWCASESGCTLPESEIRYPHQGCQLLKIASFSPYVQGFSPLKQGPSDFPFFAGAPFNMTLPQIPGYVLNPGTDFGGFYDFSCAASSMAESCMVLGPAEELGKLCILEELCQAFVYFPDGVAFDGSGPVGVLKSSGDPEKPVTINELNINPTGATYLRQDIIEEEIAAGSGSGSNSGTIIGAIVGSVVGAALIATLVGLLIITRKKYSKMAAAVATTNAELEKRTNSDSEQSSASGSGTGSASSSDAGYGSRNTKGLLRQPSPPSVVDVNSGGSGSGNYGGSTAWHRADSFEISTLDNVVVVSEMTNIKNSPRPATTTTATATAATTTAAGAGEYQGGRGIAPGSSARELLEAFSQMYAHRPPVVYVKLAEMLEDEEAIAAAAREEAQEASYREFEATSTLSRSSSLGESFEGREESEDSDFINAAGGIETGQRPTPTASSSSTMPTLSLPPQEGGIRETSGPLSQDNIDARAIQPEDVEVCRRPDGSWWQLGTGAFGTVYKGLYCGKDSVAIKVLHRLEEPRHTEAFAREVALLKTLRDRHIVQFIGACLNGPQGTAMLITELMELGDLWRALPARDTLGNRIFSWNRRGKRVMQDVARGLRYLHSKKIVHFDLKSANILLSRAGTAKLADIGMARVLHKSYLSMVSSGLGTFAWSAPEVLAGRRCGCKADIYSWGVVLWEVCTGEAPVRGIMRTLDPQKDACPVQVVDLYTRCVAENPDERPTADEVLEFLEKMD